MANLDANHEVKKMAAEYSAMKDVMDEDTYKWHHDTHYAGYVNKRNEIEKELQKADLTKANANFSAYRSLKLEETWNGNGEILHEVYWDAMGGNGNADENLDVVKRIKEDFGSFENWKNDFVACGKVSRGWAVFAIDFLTDKKTRNFLYDVHNMGGVTGSMPLISVDVFEHAYYHKFGPDRAGYINTFIANINWKKVNEKYLKYKSLM